LPYFENGVIYSKFQDEKDGISRCTRQNAASGKKRKHGMSFSFKLDTRNTEAQRQLQAIELKFATGKN